MANIRLDVNHMMKDFLGERGIDGAEMNALSREPFERVQGR